MLEDEEVVALPGESGASLAARRLVQALKEKGLEEHELSYPLQAFGHDFIVLVGPHPNDDNTEVFCWCQPELVECQAGHKHPIHVDILH